MRFETTNHRRRTAGILREGAAILICLAAAAMLMRAYGGLDYVGSRGGLRLAPMIFALAPAAAFFMVVRLFIGVLPSLIGTVSLVWVLCVVNSRKLAFTGAPLSWTDLWSFRHFEVALSYISGWQVTWVVLGVALLGWLACRSFAKQGNRLSSLRWKAPALLIALGLTLHPYFPLVSPYYGRKAENLMSDLGVIYIAFNWPENIRENGLLLHLVQTSQRPMPSAADALERQEFLQAIARSKEPAKVGNVFFILCESCWYDNRHFSDTVAPLEAEGMTAIRGVSPVYGGGTVNSTFEMLTSLPARGALNGIIFQEYEQLISPRAHTLVTSLADHNFKTYAVHNFDGAFWKRSAIYPKFGFEKFYSIKDLDYKGPIFYPRDKVMYDFVLKKLAKSPEKNFFNLETVYMHGPYQKNGSLGDKEYQARLQITMQDLVSFVRDAKAIAPDSMFVIYGDHKPALTKYFLQEKVLSETAFWRTGAHEEDFQFAADADLAVLGDVPVWVDIPGVAPEVIRKSLNTKPFYCISAMVSADYLGGGDAASEYAAENICPTYSPANYLKSALAMPPWMYYLSLFDAPSD